MKTIELSLEKSITSLCGNPYGKEVFIKQVSPFISSNEVVEVIIPDFIDSVSMSFAQGFFSAIVENKKDHKINNLVRVKSSNLRVQKKFNDAAYIRGIL